MKLYEIPFSLRKALDDVTYNEETKAVEGLEEYRDLAEEAKDKLENTAFYLCELEHDEEAIKSEIKRLTSLLKSNRNKQDTIKKLMLEAIQAFPEHKLKTAKVSMWVKKTVALDIYNEYKIPQEYFREKRTIELDTTKLKTTSKKAYSFKALSLKKINSFRFDRQTASSMRLMFRLLQDKRNGKK